MYAGNIVEVADVFDIFDNASHPYTKLLMKALPTITKEEGRLETIKGTVPDLSLPIQGCKFADRCPSCRKSAAVKAGYERNRKRSLCGMSLL